MESERSTPSQRIELDARTLPRVWPISGGALFRHQIVVTLASWRPLIPCGYRSTLDGWHNKSVGGKPLRISELNGALTRTAAYRMTICAVEQFDYLIRKINDEDLPQVTAAKAAKSSLLDSTVDLMKLLTWQDFELLVELVFSQSGWRRISASGGTQKTIDLELVLPTTGETAFVQVKSQTNQAQLDDYIERFDGRDDGRMFYVYHSANRELQVEGDRVSIIGPNRLAELVLETGLFDWLLKKVG